MKWPRNRVLSLCYVALLATLVVIGCSGKQDPSETLTTCGAHSCGDLAMITTDTSSEGFHYLDPSLRQVGAEEIILFTADWSALPSNPKDPGDAYYVNYRQVILIPVPPDSQKVEPTLDLKSQGAVLVRALETNIRALDQGSVNLAGITDWDKGDPIWVDDDEIIFHVNLFTIALGRRMFLGQIGVEGATTVSPILMEPSDDQENPQVWQHMQPSLAPDNSWLVYMRSGCAISDSLETCTNLSIWAMDMSTAGDDDGYGVLTFPITREYSRIERPRFSPDGTQIVFSGGLDVGGASGAGTEIYTMDFDTTGLGTFLALYDPYDYDDPFGPDNPDSTFRDKNIERITYTSPADGDPISGIQNTSPSFSDDGRAIYFTSTRRAPTTTLHDRNIWRVPRDGSREPDIYFFSRADDIDPTALPDGRIIMSSMVGFPTSDLNRIEREAYDSFKQDNEDSNRVNPDDYPLLSEVELQSMAADQRRQLEYFQGVMAHLYLYQ